MHGMKFLPKPKFVSAWWIWNRVRRFNWDESYECQQCRALPAEERVVVIDASRLGIKRHQFVSKQCPGCQKPAEKYTGWYGTQFPCNT